MFISALLIGIMGSLHCVVMCSPITLLIGNSKSKTNFILQRLQYNIGRLLGYGILGIFAGLFGQLIAIFGLQRWVSILIGAVILIALLLFGSEKIHNPPFKSLSYLTNWLKNQFGFIYKSNSSVKGLLIGILNGFLPCGLVYMALLGASTSYTMVQSVLFMIVFGLGTWPVMLFVSFSSGFIQKKLSLTVFRIAPYLIAILFIIRGLGLGIPYLSPTIESNSDENSIPICASHSHMTITNGFANHFLPNDKTH